GQSRRRAFQQRREGPDHLLAVALAAHGAFARGYVSHEAPETRREETSPSSFFRSRMAARKPKVIVTRKLPDPVETRMRELFDTELNVSDEPFTRAQLQDALGRADALVPPI